jgi:hypothetical protein
MAHGRQLRDAGRGQRAVTAGAADDGWPVLVAGLGRRCKLEGASGRALDMVSGEGAHPSGVPAVRGRSSGGRLHTSTPDVEVVVGSDPGEVLRLGGIRSLGPSQFGREGTDAELTDEGNGGGASAQIR